MMSNPPDILQNDHDLLIAIWTQQGVILQQQADLASRVDRSGADTTQLRLDVNKITSDVASIVSRLDETGKRLDDHSGKFKAIDTRITTLDNKSKFDISTAAVQFFLYLFGGGGAFTFAMWVYANFIRP